jgi:hypothetical protein
MCGIVESINLGSCAAMIMYAVTEAIRQHGEARSGDGKKRKILGFFGVSQQTKSKIKLHCLVHFVQE